VLTLISLVPVQMAEAPVMRVKLSFWARERMKSDWISV